MPQVINGIGTWYWGRRDIRTKRGQCPHCGRIAELVSYDTGHYVVVVFIPIIPLGRKRILDQCSICSRHNVMRLSEWEHNRDQVLPRMIDELREFPTEGERALRAIRFAGECQSEERLDEIAGIIESAQLRDAEVYALLGHHYDEFTRPESAEAAYRKALEFEDRPDFRDLLAINLVSQSRPDEAWDLIADDLHAEGVGRGGIMLLIAEAYQAWGMHDAALIILDAIAAEFPEEARQKGYKSLRKSAEKHRGTDKPVKPKLYVPAKQPHKAGSKWGARAASVVTVLVVVAAIIGFIVASNQAADDRAVYVVNGLSIPYRVSINGSVRKLRPGSATEVRVPEGELVVYPFGGDIALPEQKCVIETSFWTRLFDDTAFIVNPDRTALLLWERAEYEEYPSADSEYEYRYHCGEFLLTLPDIDYPFQQFPDSVDPSTASSVFRSRVSQVTEKSANDVAKYLNSEHGQAAAIEFARRKIAFDQDDWQLYEYYSTLAGDDALLEALKPLCNQRPVRVEAHRYYQYVAGKQRSRDELVSAYRALLDESPDDPDRIYLLARVTEAYEEKMRLLSLAAERGQPSAWALENLGHTHLTQGAFPEALRFTEAAVTLAPTVQEFRVSYSQALTASGHHEDALRCFLETEAGNRGRDVNEIYYLAMIGDRDRTSARIDEMFDEWETAYDRQTAQELRKGCQFCVTYVDGQPDAAVKLVDKFDYPDWRFRTAVIRKEWNEAAAVLDLISTDKANAALLLSALMRQAGNVEGADELLARAITKLEEDGFWTRDVCTWLRRESKPTEVEVLQKGAQIDRKVIMLIVLGQLYPEHQAAWYELARKLNFDRGFPHLSLKALLEEAEGG